MNWCSYGDGIHTYHYWGPSATAPDLVLSGPGAGDAPAGTVGYAGAGMTMIGATGGLNASTTFAQLLWANGANQPIDSLVPGGQTTTFRTGNTVGRLMRITDTITGLTPDSAAATFAMVVWDNSSGMYPTWAQASVAHMADRIVAGMSGVAVTVNQIGGTANAPPFVILPSFSLWPIPEPSTFALACLGAAALVIFRHRK